MGKVGNQTTAVKRYGEGCNRMAGVTGFEPWSSCSKGGAKESRERIVRWERFLPQRYLRVLLVESDDSTRQVVSALLRNCGYQVTAVGDAVQAWQLLENPSNCYDLVLTEVVMPSLSGIGLLCKIMSHEICQNIPVIMMSSHDSMGIVLKCLSKGAVDFLVKPVRKNELKNLWQHVWRRCHSSSGSGTGSQTQNLALPKSEAGSGSNADSNTESDNANSALNVGKGSDNESGTQSSWTKGGVEVESLQQQCKQETCEPPSSTFVEIIQPKKEKNQNDWTQLGQTVGEYRDEKSLDNIMVQALKTPFARRSATYVEQDEEENAVSDQACSRKEDAPLASCIEVGIQIDNEPTYSGFVGCGNPSLKAVDLIGTMAGEPKDRYEDPHGEIKEDVLDQGVNLSQTKDTTKSDFKFMPMLELTLKRALHSEDNNETEDKRGLRQSGVSTFLRHNTNGTHLSYPWVGSFPLNSHLLPTEHGGHSSISLGNLGTENTGSLCIAVPVKRMGSPKGSGVDAPLYHQLPQSINNQYMGSSVLGPSGQEIISTPVPIKDETALAPPVPPKRGMPMPTSSGVMPFDSISTACSFALHSMFYSHPGVPMRGSVTPHKSERGVCDNSVHHEQQMVCPQALYHSHHYNHHHHHYVHHHHHHRRASQHKQPPDQDEETVNNAMTAVRLGAASNTVGNTFDANYGQGGSSIGDGSNGKINGSASGSNNGGNGQNGQSSIAVTPGNIGGSRTGNGVSSGTGSAVDQNRCAQREAALIKFRQKRKERCFEKKVRYQSRKWLAEQRPRVRGQFVRQATYDSAATVEAD